MTFRKSLIIILFAELLVAVLAVINYDFDISGLQAVTRFSGRLSLLIFSAIFILLPYHRSKLTNILSDRFFLIFAIAHGIHLAELLSYIYFSGGKFIPIRLAGGFLAYLFIFIMPLLTGRLATKKQNLTENIYLFYVWFVFFMTYLPRVQGKLPNAGGSYPEFIILFSWVCILLGIRMVSILTSRKSHV
jgi:hypothetical protein